MPLQTNIKLMKLSYEEFTKHEAEMHDIPYKEAMGSLIYTMVGTKANLAFPMSVVSQHMSKPNPIH